MFVLIFLKTEAHSCTTLWCKYGLNIWGITDVTEKGQLRQNNEKFGTRENAAGVIERLRLYIYTLG